MSDVVPVVVATALAFLFSSTYYSVTAKQLTAARGTGTVDYQVSPAKAGIELVRSAVLATVVAVLAHLADLTTWPAGLGLGLLLWVGFPLVLWSGAVLWEGTNPRLAVLHGGDWLFKLLLVATVVTAWR